MYSRSSWGGPVDPFILTKFLNTSQSNDKDPIASLVIFEWKDRGLVGIQDPDNPANVSIRANTPQSRLISDVSISDLESAGTI